MGNMFLAAFETTIAASTQSSVGSTFSATDNIAWVATSYLIVSTAVQPLYGRASDLFGRTKVYVFSLFFFAVGCLGCGVSGSLGQMVAARAFCGVGGTSDSP
jgi:MFS family permease